MNNSVHHDDPVTSGGASKTKNNFGQSASGFFRNIFSWFCGSQLRMYYGLAFCWCFIIFLLFFIPALKGFGIFVAIIMALCAALYVTALVGPLKPADERWRRFLSEHPGLWWMGLVRLVYVLLPYYVYGWVPDKLLDSHFYRYLTTGQRPVKSTYRFCISCGEEIKSGADFCVKCGMAITKE
jgi:hypothetical protein